MKTSQPKVVIAFLLISSSALYGCSGSKRANTPSSPSTFDQSTQALPVAPLAIKGCEVKFDYQEGTFDVYQDGKMVQGFGPEPKDSAAKAASLYKKMIQGGVCKPLNQNKVCSVVPTPARVSGDRLVFTFQMDSKDITAFSTDSINDSAQYAIDLKNILVNAGACSEPSKIAQCSITTYEGDFWLFMNSNPVIGYHQETAEKSLAAAEAIRDALVEGRVCSGPIQSRTN